MTPTARERLRAEGQRILSHSLGSNPFPARGAGPSWKVDRPWILLLLAAVLWSFVRYNDTHPALCWLNAWTLAWLVLAMPIAFWLKTRIVRVLDEQVLPAMSSESLEAATQRLETSYHPGAVWGWTLATSLIWGMVAGPAMAYDLHLEGKLAGGPFLLWLVTSTVFIACAKVGCSCTFYAAICSGCRLDDVEDFPFFPTESPLLHGMARIGNLLVGFMAFTALYLITLPLGWLDEFPIAIITRLTIFLMGSLGLGMAVYARVTSRLAELLSQRRQKSLRELQTVLGKTMGHDRAEFSSAHDLLESMLSRRPSFGISTALRGAWPLFIQLGTPVLSIMEAR